MTFRQALLALALLFGLLWAAPAALAQEGQPGPVTEDQVNQVAKKLYCPVCENVPLDVCPTVACAQWRATIREKLEEGWNEQQILDYFALQYGDRSLASPPARGISALVWIVPPVMLVLGALALWRYLRTNPRLAEAASAKVPQPARKQDDPYVDRLEQELRRRS